MYSRNTATKTQPYRQRLVEAIEQRLSRPLVASVWEAFLHVPRDAFVESYYEQRGNSFSWDQFIAPSLEAIYRDEALVTQLDTRSRPTSSSSQPSVMAAQLEVLDLHRGNHVLEIGAGTGYNAALMAYLVGDAGQVISIDIDADLVITATRHLANAAVKNVFTIHRDGFAGYPIDAPYDRLLATCGVKCIPRAWLYQLQQDGVLICNVLLNLASVFVRMEKISPTTLGGCLLNIEAQYMKLRNTNDQPYKSGIKWKKYHTLPYQKIDLSANLADLLKNPAYSILLQCLLPTIHKHYRWRAEHEQPDIYLLEYAHATSDSAMLVRDDYVRVYGDNEQIGELIKQSITLYERLGRPAVADYRVSISEERATLSIADMSFPLAI